MLNELLKDEEWSKILFAHLLNQNGCDTGVDTVNLTARKLEGEELERFKQKLVKNIQSNNNDMVVLGDVLDKEHENEDDNMEDIPMSIRELEEIGKDTERLAEPDYYAGNGLSPLEAFKKGLLSRDELIGFIKGNVIKYTVRAGHKHNASEDIVKAIDYLTHLKKLYESYDISNQAQEIVKQAFENLNKIEERQ